MAIEQHKSLSQPVGDGETAEQAAGMVCASMQPSERWRGQHPVPNQGCPL